jgi:hypothetical protein
MSQLTIQIKNNLGWLRVFGASVTTVLLFLLLYSAVNAAEGFTLDWQSEWHRVMAAAVMIKGHGANVTGSTVQEARLNTVNLDQTAKMIMWAQSVGKLSPFPADVIKSYRFVEAERVTRRGSWPACSREWNY